MIGQRFGKWTVISEAPPKYYGKKSFTTWLCRCDCGTERIVVGSDLRAGKTTQCRKCAHPSIKNKTNKESNPNTSRPNVVDETGNVYGRLTVIQQAPSDSRGAAMWVCQCSCGNTITVRGNSLRNGHVMSCGCLQSKGEAKITLLLEQNHISYKRQFSFPDLKSSNGGLLKFDFAIFDANNQLIKLIEYQGEQHYQERMPSWWNSPIPNDELKRNYCATHNIQLTEIAYTDYKDLTINQLLQ